MEKETLKKFPLKKQWVIMLAPSFVVDFSYPSIISKLRKLGFDKIVEVTFGAKMINREYHKTLSKSDKMKIASVCPGIVEYIKNNYPKYKKNLIPADSPMTAMAKVCKKTYPKHKIAFLSPCNFKKIEAQKCKNIDLVLTFRELKEIIKKHKIKSSRKKETFDKFYNDYTKIYPLSGGLTKTAHLKGVLDKKNVAISDGINKVKKLLENSPEKKYKFLDVTFCTGGCIGGPSVTSKKPIQKRKKSVLDYMKKSKHEDIPEDKKGLIKCAKDLSFKKNI
jgi:iron only hydrogenase large subunit-like protein